MPLRRRQPTPARPLRPCLLGETRGGATISLEGLFWIAIGVVAILPPLYSGFIGRLADGPVATTAAAISCFVTTGTACAASGSRAGQAAERPAPTLPAEVALSQARDATQSPWPPIAGDAAHRKSNKRADAARSATPTSLPAYPAAAQWVGLVPASTQLGARAREVFSTSNVSTALCEWAGGTLDILLGTCDTAKHYAQKRGDSQAVADAELNHGMNLTGVGLIPGATALFKGLGAAAAIGMTKRTGKSMAQTMAENHLRRLAGELPEPLRRYAEDVIEPAAMAVAASSGRLTPQEVIGILRKLDHLPSSAHEDGARTLRVLFDAAAKNPETLDKTRTLVRNPVGFERIATAASDVALNAPDAAQLSRLLEAASGVGAVSQQVLKEAFEHQRFADSVLVLETLKRASHVTPELFRGAQRATDLPMVRALLERLAGISDGSAGFAGSLRRKGFGLALGSQRDVTITLTRPGQPLALLGFDAVVDALEKLQKTDPLRADWVAQRLAANTHTLLESTKVTPEQIQQHWESIVPVIDQLASPSPPYLYFTFGALQKNL